MPRFPDLQISRRTLFAITATAAIATRSGSAFAQTPAPLSLHTAGPGSLFLPYGTGLAGYVLAKGGPRIAVVETSGSLANLRAVNESPNALGTVFLGSALDAMAGTGPFEGGKLTNLRALIPMYETSFQTAALAGRGIVTVRDLGGKKVGVGPKGGPAEVFFRGLVQIAGVEPVIVNGNPADQTKALLAGEIDAFWQGAIVPIPALKAAADAAEVVIFGASDADVAAMLAKFPALAPTIVPAGSYRGQTTPLKSISAWNFVLAHKDMTEVTVAQFTRLALAAANPAGEIHPAAGFTRGENAVHNTVVPFHPGALLVYREMGIKVPGL